MVTDNEDEQVRTVAERNAHSILHIRLRTEEELRRQSEWLRVTLASIADAVISTDSENRITFMNGVAQSLTGWSESEALGRQLDEVFRVVDEHTRHRLRGQAFGTVRDGERGRSDKRTLLVGRDGTERPISNSLAPIRDESGNDFGAVLVFRDVTESCRAEAVLRKANGDLESQVEQRTTDLVHANRFLSTLLDSLQDGILACDAQGTLTLCNEATRRFFAMKPGPLSPERVSLDRLTERCRIFDPTGEIPLSSNDLPLARALLGEIIDDLEIVVTPEGQSPRTFLASARAFHDDRGQIIGAVMSMHDVTLRKQTEEALRKAHNELDARVQQRTLEDELRRIASDLEEADQRKNEFLAMLAHELRNPLAPISNALRILQLSGVDAEVVRSACELMERQIRHMVHLVDDLLDVSRITRGKIELRRETINLSSVINQAIETSRPAIEAAGHELIVSMPARPVHVCGDSVRLAQVFSNLLNNSSKYSDPGGSIRLTAECQGSDVQITVKDTGVGIPPPMLPKVFDLFTQVDQTLARSQGGLGIGLTLVRRLVELHDGSVQAFSEGVGRGSEFVVRLPIVVEHPKAPTVDSNAAPQAPATSPRRILVVDDNRDSANTLAMLLRMTGNETRTAHDGLEAVELASSFLPDIVLLDIGLPRLNGFEVAQRIRSESWGERMVLIALTGWGQAEDRQRSKEAGFDAHLVKPLDLAALRKLISELLPSEK